jgi:adenosine deaminase
MTVSNTDAILEMKRMKETFKLSNKIIERILLTSVEHSFITSKEKELLKNKILKKVLI